MHNFSRMGFGKRVISSGEAVVDRVLCVVGAVLFSQAPEFMQQYLQRLGGHLDEARRTLAQYEGIARQSNMTIGELIARTSANADAVVAKHAGVMQNVADRVHDLAAAQTAIQDASMFTRPFAFLQHIDWGIASNTWSIFKPAVPTTAEGLVYAVAGIGVILGFYYGCIHFPITHFWRKRRERKAEARLAAEPQPPPNAAGPYDNTSHLDDVL